MYKSILIFILITISCKAQDKENVSNKKITPETLNTSEFKLIKAEKQSGLLILFPCFPCDAENTLNEFNVANISVQKGFSVLAMNLNQHLYLKETEKQQLTALLTNIIKEQKLSKENIFIGGFSSGGNVSLLISDYLIKTNNEIHPKGVFIVDSPIDLLGLYKTAIKNLELNFSKVAVEESTWIQNFLGTEFGEPANGITNYEVNSPYTFETQNIDNLIGLSKLKIRFYTEPDLKWWRDNRNREFEGLNAFYIQQLSEKLKTEFGNTNVELINTENRGYRANGERHPHSWSIVNEKDLIDWMMK